MTTTTDRLIALRALLHAGDPVAEEMSPIGQVSVLHDPSGGVDHVQVLLTSPIEVADLVGSFGEPRELPRLPTGARRVIFPDTQPKDGERAITLVAELDRSGHVTAIMLRPDDFT